MYYHHYYYIFIIIFIYKVIKYFTACYYYSFIVTLFTYLFILIKQFDDFLPLRFSTNNTHMVHTFLYGSESTISEMKDLSYLVWNRRYKIVIIRASEEYGKFLITETTPDEPFSSSSWFMWPICQSQRPYGFRFEPLRRTGVCPYEPLFRTTSPLAQEVVPIQERFKLSELILNRNRTVDLTGKK